MQLYQYLLYNATSRDATIFGKSMPRQQCPHEESSSRTRMEDWAFGGMHGGMEPWPPPRSHRFDASGDTLLCIFLWFSGVVFVFCLSTLGQDDQRIPRARARSVRLRIAHSNQDRSARISLTSCARFIAEFAQISRVGPDEDRRVKAIDELIHHTQHAWKGVESSEDEQTTQCSLCLESFQDGELVLRLPWCRLAICMPLQTLSELTPLNPRLAPQCPFLPLELRRDMVPLDATQGALVPSLQTKPAPQRRRVRTH